jgi:hypothetical protein
LSGVICVHWSSFVASYRLLADLLELRFFAVLK